MTVQEMKIQIRLLSFEERLELLEFLTHALRDQYRPASRKGSSLARVRGILKTEEPTPTDEELADAYTNHLMEKYS
ncbi:MAG: hypothetical protein AB1631_25250 [Acidobacteriota bacterium]